MHTRVRLRLCVFLVLRPHRSHEDLRLALESGGTVGVSCLLIFTCSGLTLGDFHPDNLIDLRAAQAAPLDFASAKPGRSARKMRASAGGGGSSAAIRGFGIADRAKR